MWSQVRSLMGSVAEEGQDLVLTATVVGIDVAAITQVRDLLQGLVALAKFGKPKDGDEIGPAIIASAQFTLDGSTLTARARCPVVALLHALDRGQPAGPGERRRRGRRHAGKKMIAIVSYRRRRSTMPRPSGW